MFAHVLLGQLNKQIATDMGIDERSVKRHRTSLMAKLKVHSVVKLTQLADELQLIESNTKKTFTTLSDPLIY